MKNVAEGLQRFVIGLAKKVLIADQLAVAVDAVFAESPSNLSPYVAWFGICCFSLQIYYDFSGYSDMAIGLGRVLGFKFPENFAHPYSARDIQSFWRKWHMTLSRWFRDYVYIPLGGNRHSTLRTSTNLFTVFFLCGLWHGANWTFVIWGLFHGLFLSLERIGLRNALERLPALIRHIYVFLVVVIGWVFFRSENINHAIEYLVKMFSLGNFLQCEDAKIAAYSTDPFLFLIIAIGLTFSFPLMPIRNRLTQLSESHSNSFLLIRCGAMVTTMTLCFGGIASQTYNAFIYFRF